jgi:hypothetical protein
MRTQFGLVAMLGGCTLFVINAIHEFIIHHWWGFFFMYWNPWYPFIVVLTLIGWHYRHVGYEETSSEEWQV